MTKSVVTIALIFFSISLSVNSFHDPKFDELETTFEKYKAIIEDLKSENDSAIIFIENITIDYAVKIDTIPIYIQSSIEIGGFDLKIAIETNSGIRIEEIFAGDFKDSCKWEMFNTRDKVGGGNDQLTTWKIISLSEVVPDDTTPLCFKFDKKAVLCNLVISIKNYDKIKDKSQPIYFYWESCRDNILSSKSGTKIYLSENHKPDSTNSTNSMPNKTGDVSSCISKKQKSSIRGIVKFRNPVIKLKPTLTD